MAPFCAAARSRSVSRRVWPAGRRTGAGAPAGVARNGDRSRELAADYDWDDVAGGYEELARQLAARQFPRRRPSGRRWPQTERRTATIVPFPRRADADGAAADPQRDAAGRGQQ